MVGIRPSGDASVNPRFNAGDVDNASRSREPFDVIAVDGLHHIVGEPFASLLRRGSQGLDSPVFVPDNLLHDLTAIQFPQPDESRAVERVEYVRLTRIVTQQ